MVSTDFVEVSILVEVSVGQKIFLLFEVPIGLLCTIPLWIVQVS